MWFFLILYKFFLRKELPHQDVISIIWVLRFLFGILIQYFWLAILGIWRKLTVWTECVPTKLTSCLNFFFFAGFEILKQMLSEERVIPHLPLAKMWEWQVGVACRQTGHQRLKAIHLLLKIVQCSSQGWVHCSTSCPNGQGNTKALNSYYFEAKKPCDLKLVFLICSSDAIYSALVAEMFYSSFLAFKEIYEFKCHCKEENIITKQDKGWFQLIF